MNKPMVALVNCPQRRWLALIVPVVLAWTGRAAGQSQITIAAPVGAVPQFWVDMNPFEPGIQVARVVEPGFFEVDIVAFNIPEFPQPIRHALLWFRYNETAIRLCTVTPPLLGGMPDAAAGACYLVPATPPCTIPPPIGCAGPGMGPNTARVVVDRPPGMMPGCAVFGPGPDFVVARLVFVTVGEVGQSGIDIFPGFPPPPEINMTGLHRYPGIIPPDSSPCDPDYVPIVPAVTLAFGRGRVVVDSTGTLSCLNVNRTSDVAATGFAVSIGNPDTGGSQGIDDVTLRSAIQAANALPGPNRITFRMTGSTTINVQSALPTLDDDATEIDGETQPGVVLNGSAAALRGPPVNGLTIASADCVLRFLTINNFAAGAGIRITGATATNNLVVGSKLGTNTLGTVVMPNLDGIVIEAGAQSNIIGLPGAIGSNVISGNVHDGIRLTGAETKFNMVRNNYVGTNSAGAALGNEWGIVIDDQANDNQVGTLKNFAVGVDCGLTAAQLMDRNTICDNTYDGIALAGLAQSNSIQGNWVGVTLAGEALGNGAHGINLVNSHLNCIDENIVGNNGLLFANSNGINLLNSNINFMRCNHVGTSDTDLVDHGNKGHGISIVGIPADTSISNIIGQTTLARDQVFRNGNVIRYNDKYGFVVFGQAGDNDLVASDLRYNGTVGINSGGILIQTPPDVGALVIDTKIGGSRDVLHNNVIRENIGPGINIAGSATELTQVFGNDIIDNTREGIRVSEGALVTIIGARFDDSKRNIITGNTLSGVAIVDAAAGLGTQIVRNSIYDNGPQERRGSADTSILGIDLSDDGVTPNDLNDGDRGPNHLQNFPVLDKATICCGGIVTIAGVLNSVPGESFHLEFFLNDSCDPGHPAEGKTYLGNLALPDQFDRSVNDPTLPFTVIFAGPANVGQFVTATATSEAFDETSEFSACRVVTTVLGDLDGNGFVNGADLGLLLAVWGPCPGCAADLNGDGVVNGADLGLVLSNWG